MTLSLPPRPPERGRIGFTPTVRGRLALQRPRPFLVRLYAALLGDGGALGPAARRRLARRAVEAVPFAVALGAAVFVAIGAFDAPVPGWAPTLATAALAVALGATVWRRTVRAAGGERSTGREQLELGVLFVVAAYAMTRTASGGAADSPLQPLVYLVMAFLVAFLGRRVGFAVVLLAVALELLVWRGRGARPAELPAAVVHAGFVTLFAVLYHAVLAARVAAVRRAEQSAIDRRLAEIEERAREFRLLAPAERREGEDDERRWTESAVLEIEAAVRGALEVAEVALRSHTCAVFLLSPDDRELKLRECRSRSDAVQRAPFPAGEGALGGAVRRKAPVRLSGELKAPSYYADATRPGALLAVPLLDRRGEHVRGVVVADRLEALAFTDQDERLLATLSAEIVRAVASEKLMADLRAGRDEKERFYGAIERLNRTAKPPEVFDAVIEAARAMVPVDLGAVTLAEGPEGKRTHRVARVVSGEGVGGAEGLEGRSFGDDEVGLVAAAVRLGSSLPGTDLDLAKANVFDAATRLKGIASVKVVPLKTGDRVLGTLVLGARGEGAYAGDAVRQLEVVAMQAADSILRARLFEETERLATTDGLTGLTNHRTFQARLDEALAQAERYGKKLSMLLCDIDHFKSVNDTYGHPAGDEVLRGVARALAKEARATDVVARYGGEEFAIVMPETDTEGAVVIAERIRAKVGAIVFQTEQGPLRVTMSLGVATYPEDGAKKPLLVERADGCLYHAKRHGRNQTVAAAALRAPRRAAG